MEKVDLIELVQKHWPSAATDDQVEDVLFNVTSFPFGSMEYITNQLIEYHAKSGGDIDLAMAIVSKEMDETWEKYKLENNTL